MLPLNLLNLLLCLCYTRANAELAQLTNPGLVGLHYGHEHLMQFSILEILCLLDNSIHPRCLVSIRRIHISWGLILEVAGASIARAAINWTLSDLYIDNWLLFMLFNNLQRFRGRQCFLTSLSLNGLPQVQIWHCLLPNERLYWFLLPHLFSLLS